MSKSIAIATWTFGRIAVEAAENVLAKGGTALDAAIAGAQAVEDDPTVNSVGYGGLGDASGVVTLDASVMEGRTLSCGGVAGVENVRHVAALARRVMEATPHVLLVGNGAQQFAIQQGFPLEPLHTAASVAEWEQRKAKAVPGQLVPHPGAGGEGDHDTVTVLARDVHGDLAGCCTTSGLAFRLPGRIGDSPIIGAGLYADNEVGAAGATGVGEEVVRICGSATVIEAMRNGASAQEACEAAARRVVAVAKRRGVPAVHLAFLALDRNGVPGACCTAGTTFHYAVAVGSAIKLLKAVEVS